MFAVGRSAMRVRVAAMTARDLEELCVMRVSLEAEAVRLSVPEMTSEDIARLEGYMAEMAHYSRDKDYRRWGVQSDPAPATIPTPYEGPAVIYAPNFEGHHHKGGLGGH